MSAHNPLLPDEQATAAHGAPASATVAEPGSAEPPFAQGQWLEEPDELPRRPRRRLLTPLPLSLLAALLVALGFIGGVLVEKGQGPSSSSGASAATGSSLASRFRALAGARGGASTEAAGAGAAGARGGFTKPTVGTVSYLEGNTLYVTNAEGNTVKVTTSPATGVSKSVKTTVPGIRPGETVSITGSSGTNGAISAESITVGSGGGLGGLFAGTGTARGSGAESSGKGESQPLFGGG